MIRALTVDWWHTIAEPPGGDWESFAKRLRCEGIQAVLRKHGIEATGARLDVAYDLWTNHLARAWKRLVDLSAEEQIADFLVSAGYDGVATSTLIADLREPFGTPLLTRTPSLHEGVERTLRDLKEHGVRLAMISNTGRTWGVYLRQVQEKLGVGDLFEHRTFSDEMRVRKPAPLIFRQTLASLRLPPEAVAHIGDDVDADVAGARGAGMRSIWYDTGKWVGAVTDSADSVIHSWSELPKVLEAWSP